MVLPFINSTHRQQDNWLTEAYRILLSEYLTLNDKAWIFPNRMSVTTFDINEAIMVGRKFEMDYVVIGSFSYKDPILKTYVIVIDTDKGVQVGRFEKSVEYPSSVQSGLLFFNLASDTSQALGMGALKEKQYFSFINNPRRAEALKYYIMADMALHEGDPDGVKDALDLYLKAIQNDYNYAHGYLGYAQSLAVQGFIQKLEDKSYRVYYERAERELQKAMLLNPKLADARKNSIMRFLQAEVHEVAGRDWLARNKLSRATKEFEKAAALLPGNPSVKGYLAGIYRKRGKDKTAEKHYREYRELNRCGP
jgi:tetratricopeptide (TPR) repeat protein